MVQNFRKNILTVALFATALLSGEKAEAFQARYNGLLYEMTDSTRTATLIRDSTRGDFRGPLGIPEEVEYELPDDEAMVFKVTKVGDNAFANFPNVSSITFPKTLEHIGKNAFKNCTGLKSLNIPGNVKEIDRSAFYGCSNLAELNLGEGVEEIGGGAFYDCRKLTSIIIPSSTKYISTYAFVGCNLDKIYSHVNDTSGCDISSEAFSRRDSLGHLPIDTIYIPFGTKDKFEEAWNSEKSFEFIEMQNGESLVGKCEKPTISLEGDMGLYISSFTKNSTCSYSIRLLGSEKTGDFNGVIHFELQAYYAITAQAFAENHLPSEEVKAYVYLSCGELSVEAPDDDESSETQEPRSLKPFSAVVQGNEVSIFGLEGEQQVTLYNISGRIVGSARAIDGTASISVNGGKRGDIIIVRAGNQSAKVILP